MPTKEDNRNLFQDGVEFVMTFMTDKLESVSLEGQAATAFFNVGQKMQLWNLRHCRGLHRQHWNP